MRLILIIVMTMLFLGCSQDSSIRDLQNNLEKLKQTTIQNKTKKPSIILPPPTPAVYQAASQRNPFIDPIDVKTGGKKAHPLNTYSLSLLRFVGTISKNQQMNAVIMTPDNKIYQIKVGDTIGDRYARIVNIYPDRLEVIEQTTDDGKTTAPKIVTLQLKDGS